MSQKPPDTIDTSAPTPAGPSAPSTRGRSRQLRHLATTARLHALRSAMRDETTLLARVCEILADAFNASGVCLGRRVAGDAGAAVERRACAHRGAPTFVCDPARCRALFELPLLTLGEAHLDLVGPARVLVEVRLSDGDQLIVAIDAPFQDTHAPLKHEDLRDDLAHVEEFGRVLVDVLDAERAHERLREREQELSSVLGAIPDILTIIDADGRVVGFHNGDERHPIHPDEVLGRHMSELMESSAWRTAQPVWQRAIATRRVQEHRYSVERDGRTLHFVARAQAYGDPARVLWHTRDVTEERRLQEKLLSIQRFEGIALLASALAHDFSNLLTGILGNAEFARVETPADTPAAEALGDVISAARRASDLCQQLLGMSGKRRFSLGFVNLSCLCEEMLVILRTSIGRRVTVVRELIDPATMPVLIADAVQLRQIVLNLLSHASDAIGDDGGVITVRTGVQADDDGEARSAFVEVEDSGRGMDELVRRRLLEPFLAVPLETRELGLAATFGIVRAHGGTVEVAAGAAGGTRVRVLLPLDGDAERAHEEVAPIDEPPHSALARGGLVMVVTPDPSLVAICRRALEQAGHRVQHIASGEEAAIALRAIAGLLRGVVIDSEALGPGAHALLAELTTLAPTVPHLALGGEGAPAAISDGAPPPRSTTAEALARSLARLIAQL